MPDTPKPRRGRPSTALENCDVEAVEREYRAGQLSVREIGHRHSVHEATIRKWVKKFGWSRDLSRDVHRETLAKLQREEEKSPGARHEPKTDREIVEHAGERGAAVVRGHRGKLASVQALAVRLFGELDATTTHIGEIEALLLEKDPNKRDKAAHKAITLQSRTFAMNALVAALKNLIILERQAYNLDGAQHNDEDDLDALIKLTRAAASNSLRSRIGGNDTGERES